MSTNNELDGSGGWAVVVAAFITHFITHGMVYSYGILLISFEDVFGGTKAEVAWIASITTGSLYLSGPLASICLCRHGSRIVSLCGAILSATGYGLTIFAPNLYFMYFSLGFLTGVGYGLMFMPAVVEVTMQFKRHRALACGIALCGAGTGAFVFSPLIEYLLNTYAWRGTLIICSGLLLNLVPCSLLFRNKFTFEEQGTGIMKRKHVPQSDFQVDITVEYRNCDTNVDLLKSSEVYSNTFSGKHTTGSNKCVNMTTDEPTDPSSVSKSSATDRLILANGESNFDHQKGNENLSSCVDVRNSANCLCCGLVNISICQIIQRKEMMLFYSSQILFFVGFYFPFIGIPDMALKRGIEEGKVVWIISAIGISSVVGRVVLGYISDRPFMNSLHMFKVALLVAGISTSLVPVLLPYGALIIYAIIYGLSTGVVLSQTTVVLVEIIGLQRMSDAMGLNNMFSGIGALIGPPVLGMLYDQTASYTYPFIVSGLSMTLGGILLLLMKLCTIQCT